MGQGSSREKGKSKKGSASKNGVKPNPPAAKDPSNNKKGRRNSKKGKKQRPKELAEVEPPSQLDLLEKVACEIENSGLETPRFGIFEDVLPTVCVEEDGVSLSSASSEEDTHPRARIASVHRSSSRKLRKTYSSGRKKSRAARIAKRSYKGKPSDKRAKQEPTVNDLHDELSVTKTSHITECVLISDGHMLTDDTLAVLSGDDSGCSTLEDHLFPDDSLSEEVLSCLVSRGMEFDSDVSEVTDTTNHSLIPPPKPRRDEGYESLQKISQLGNSQNRQKSPSPIHTASGHQNDPVNTTDWTRNARLDDSPRTLVTSLDQQSSSIDDGDWPLMSTPQPMNSTRFDHFVPPTEDSILPEEELTLLDNMTRGDGASADTRCSSNSRSTGSDDETSPPRDETGHKESCLDNTPESEALGMGFEVVPLPDASLFYEGHAEKRPTGKQLSSSGKEHRSAKGKYKPSSGSEEKRSSKSGHNRSPRKEDKSNGENKGTSKSGDKRTSKREERSYKFDDTQPSEYGVKGSSKGADKCDTEFSSQEKQDKPTAVEIGIHRDSDGESGVQEDTSVKSGHSSSERSWDSGCSSGSLNIGQAHTSEVYV